MKKIIFIFLGSLFVALAAVGAIVPGVPTTPFVLVSAYFFARSSERSYNWLREHRTFGPLLRAWQEERAIPYGARIVALLSMILSAYLIGWSSNPALARIFILLVLLGSALYVTSRPIPRRS
jgi:hypothetical protein